ncbi:LADA_0G07602g1_1 [Lachancea dasiensis]|uniref:LADA_0G07602g1_1 n=1 Tax=Lachancea dasiensis TaxID=1072105 RepID=A0A1G4JTP3_9SACH|nr:LADA_0G07602g1_1 [Lachancea dasiensis]
MTEKNSPPAAVDQIKALSRPSGGAEGKHHIVIVGAGIIGVCTAYYLTRHPSFDKSNYHITLLESKRVAGGASGKAGGLLATWAFPQQIVPLSFQLHQELSDEYNGETQWDYRRLTTVSVEADVQNVAEEEEDNKESIGDSASHNAGSASDKSSNSRSHTLATRKKTRDPRTTTPSSKKRCAKTTRSDRGETGPDGVDEEDEEDQVPDEGEEEDEVDGSVDDEYEADADSEAVSSSQAQSDSDSDEIQESYGMSSGSGSSSNASSLPEDLNWIRTQLVRDWSSLGGTDSTAQVHPYKFTHFILNEAMKTGAVDLILGKVKEIHFDDMGCASGVSYIPTSDEFEGQPETTEMLGAQQVVLAMGPWTSKILPDCPISGLRAHSITIKPSTGTVSPYAIFTELKIGRNKYFSPEMYARKDEVYVCGEGDTLVELPETTDAVEVVREKCDELYHYVSKLSPNLSKGHILKRQACYLPVLNVPTSSGPLIGETNIEGLYVASGHSCWGINNAPGTGKIMSEVLLDGVATSADISALDPGLYFDASILE